MALFDQVSRFADSYAGETETPASVTTLLVLYDEVSPALNGYLAARGYGANDIEDFVHESFLRLHRELLQGCKISHPRAWLFRTAHNLALNHIRDSHFNVTNHEEDGDQALAQLAGTAPNPEEQLLMEERFERLQRGLSQLTASQVQCLQLRAEGLKYREIAEVMALTTQRVGQIIAAGLKRLVAFQ